MRRTLFGGMLPHGHLYNAAPTELEEQFDLVAGAFMKSVLYWDIQRSLRFEATEQPSDQDNSTIYQLKRNFSDSELVRECHYKNSPRQGK